MAVAKFAIRIISAILFIVSGAVYANAAWQGPIEVISGTWGSGVGEFGYESGDTEDIFPLIEAITPDGKIVLDDYPNKKQIIFDLNGNFVKEVQWIIVEDNSKSTVYNIEEYSFGHVVGYSNDGNIYSGGSTNYYLQDNKGQLIAEYNERPLELGRAVDCDKYICREFSDESATGGVSKYKYSRSMPNETMHRINGKLFVADRMNAYHVDGCGRQMASMQMPASITRYAMDPEGAPQGMDIPIEAVEEYGPVNIAPNGDIYTWKRTPETYSIIKWTWVDEGYATAPPPPPAKLQTRAQSDGIQIFWNASSQDWGGCVTGYELQRAESAEGSFEIVSTKGSNHRSLFVAYTDADTVPGKTYYYRVRATSDFGPSEYTEVVEGKR